MNSQETVNQGDRWGVRLEGVPSFSVQSSDVIRHFYQ